MKYLTVILCLIAFNLCAQEPQFEQILAIKNLSEMPKNCSDFSWAQEDFSLEETRVSTFSLELTAQKPKNISLRYETQLVSILNYDGFNFHVADYFDGTRIVTCLDGDLKGLQGIAVNGVKVVECNNVEWYKTHFLHHYPTGVIYSYASKQIVEVF